MASGTMVNLPTCETHYEWLEPVGGATEAAEVVVLAHGFSGESGHLRGLAHEVRKAGFRALIYDLVGRGYSSCRDVNHTAHLFVSQLNELMDTLEVREFHLVGLSLGGGVAVSFAQYFPKRVKSLTLIAAVGLKMRVSRARRETLRDPSPLGPPRPTSSRACPCCRTSCSACSSGRPCSRASSTSGPTRATRSSR